MLDNGDYNSKLRMELTFDDNQFWPVQSWANSGAAISLGDLNSLDKSSLIRHVNQLVLDKNMRENLANRANNLCNGFGVKYIVNSILN